MKYRIKTKSGRIIGPFDYGEIIGLVNVGEINKENMFQEFPHGDWQDFKNYPELDKIFDFPSDGDETHVANLKKIIKDKSGNHTDESNSENTPNFSELTEFKYKKGDKTKISPKVNRDFDLDEDRKTELNKTSKDNSDKTKVRTIHKNYNENFIEKTRINPDYQKYLDEIKSEKSQREKEKSEDIQVEEYIPDYENEATQMLESTSLLSNIKELTSTNIQIEEDLTKTNIDIKNIDKTTTKELKSGKKNANHINKKLNDKKRKRTLIFGITFILFVLFILPDENDVGSKQLKPIKIIEPFIKFPSRYDVEDENKSIELHNKGLSLLRLGGYKNTNDAAKYFYQSLENKFDENKAGGKLIFSFSYLLENSKNFIENANSIFKLVLYFQNKTFSDPDYATAVSMFYYSIGKYSAALTTYDKYITLNRKFATAELFAVRLMALIKLGILDEAKDAADKLLNVKNKDLFSLIALLEYYGIQENDKVYNNLMTEAKENFPDSAEIMILEGELLIKKNKLKELKSIVKSLNNINVEGSRNYYAKYLKLLGMYHVGNGNNKLAIQKFQKSLSIKNDIKLISTLALLEAGADKNVNELIYNSRAKQSILNSREYFQKGESTAAMKEALNATSIAPDMIEARLNLIKLQLDRGYIKDAIVDLEELYKENSSSLEILFLMIDAYTRAFKFNRVVELLATAEGIAGGQEYKFYTAKARYSLFKGDLNTASGWLQRAINANPIDDINRFELAKLYIKYNDFKKGKSTLKKAMDLDPSNIKYKLEFAKILYEVENANSAIAYLYNVLEDFPDNPKLLSLIGIYYYRSGQIKNYKDVKKKLLAIPKKDPSLYEFLIESSRLDDDILKVIEYSKDLIEIEPGNLEARMKLANTLIELQRYKEAKIQLDAIDERLDTYPNLQYLKAKLYYLIDDLEKAKELALLEVKQNPIVVEGYILLGDIFVKEKDLLNARKYYLKAVQIKPKNVDAIMGIAYVAFHSDQYDMALDQYQRAIEIDPNRAETYKLLGDAYRKLGQSQLAIKNYQQFLEISPNSKYKSSIQTYIRTMK